MDDGKKLYPGFYRPLPSGLTRVLELQPGEFSDPVVGRLVPQAILNGPQYEAISYVWGDKLKRRNITIDGLELGIPESLYGALTAFRYRPVPNNDDRRVRRLWADAVCINQEDLPERISQVEQMARIYAGADRVLAWLGWEEGEDGRQDTKEAIRFIHSFMDNPDMALSDARILLHDHHHDHQEDEEKAALDLAAVISGDEERRLFDAQARKWSAVKAFFEIEYFHRTWIVQELGLARQAVLYTALRPREQTAHGSQGQAGSVELDSIGWPLLGRFVEFMDFSGASLVTHLGLSSWVAHHILMVWAIDDKGAPACDFLTGMHWARILRVTDPRDRVYGLLGHPLAVMDDRLIIKPDYSQTRGVVYTRLAVHFIRQTKGLYVVSLVDHEIDPSDDPKRLWDPQHESRMPSWVPDWHEINRTTPLEYTYPASEIEDADVHFEGDSEGTAGLLVPHLRVRGWVVDEVVAVSQRMETTDFPVTLNLRRELAKKNPFWLVRMWEEVLFPIDLDNDDSQPTYDDALDLLEMLSLALTLGVKDDDREVGRVGDKQTLQEHQRSFAAYILDYHKLWCSLTEADKAMFSWPVRRSLFESLPADVRAEIQRRAEGTTSEGFIECMTWPSMCRVVYRTASGLVGIGSRLTRPGDLVCRVRGSSVLMTLRRIDNSTDQAGKLETVDIGMETGDEITCAHIGPAVVPARMRKGVLDGGKFGERPTRFRIV